MARGGIWTAVQMSTVFAVPCCMNCSRPASFDAENEVDSG